MKILVSDVDQAHADACKNKILEECPTAVVTTRLESLSASIDYALLNHIHIISRSTTGLSDSRNENEGDTAWAGVNVSGKVGSAIIGASKIGGDIIFRVGIVHALGSNSHIRDTDPSRLDIISAVSGGDGSGHCVASYGPGLEFFCNEETTQSYSTARIAGIIGQLMIDHPDWNFHDARMALRQTASFYNTAWIEDGGYGAVDKAAANAVTTIAMFSPIRKEIIHNEETKKITFKWINSPQSNVVSSIIAKYGKLPDRNAIPTQEDAKILYNGLLQTYEYDYSGTFLGTYYFVFHTAGSYSLIESFDVNEITTGAMAEFIRLTSSITRVISLTSKIDMEEI